MIDLHLHLDGSINPKNIAVMAQMSSIPLELTEEEAKQQMMISPDCISLKEYLEKFNLPLRLLQTKECLEYAVYELIHDLHLQGLCYAEIRFAPQLHTQNGLSQDDVVQAAIRGLQRGWHDFQFPANLILCCMRGAQNKVENTETVQTAAKYLNEGVCAVDLAGDEAAHPTETFHEVFQLAKELHIPAIIHAGEAAGAESIHQALALGAVRIGHGIHATEDATLLDILKNNRIYLEMCYSSNLQTKAADSPETYPLVPFLQKGLGITINTDNTTVSDTSLKKEYLLLQKQFSLDDQTLLQLALNSADAAFLPEAKRCKLKERIQKDFFSWLA